MIALVALSTNCTLWMATSSIWHLTRPMEPRCHRRHQLEQEGALCVHEAATDSVARATALGDRSCPEGTLLRSENSTLLLCEVLDWPPSLPHGRRS